MSTYLRNITNHEVVDIVETAISRMDLTDTAYAEKTFNFFHGQPLDVKKEHNVKQSQFPVIILFEPLNTVVNLSDSSLDYKTTTITLYIMDILPKFRGNQTELAYTEVINNLGLIVIRLIDSFNNEYNTLVRDIETVNETNWTQWSVGAAPIGSSTQTVLFENLCGKEISFDLITKKNNC